MADLEEILRIEKEAFPKSPYSRFTFLYYAKTQPNNFLIYVEESLKKVIGYVIFYPEGHIASIVVDSMYRRRGIGTKLVREVLKASKGNARVEVRESNEIAKKFYKKLGFFESFIIPQYYGDEDAIVMVRSSSNSNEREDHFNARNEC